MSLKILIEKFAEDNEFKKYVKYPILFNKSIKELDSMIGNNDAKESIAKQIIVYLTQKNNGNVSDKTMQNIIFSGDPGVGKTMIAGKVAKILFSLGIVKLKERGKTTVIREMIKENSSDSLTMLYIIILLGMILISVISYTWRFFRGIGFLYSIIIIAIFLILVGSTCYYLSSSPSSTTSTTTIETKVDKKDQNPMLVTDVNEDDIFKVVTRTDFIDRYVGHSDKKTKALLMDNLGKVLFIDEAYSIAKSTNDTFGMEALDTLNLFLSQHPDEIIVIMAGYEDLLNETIFAYQPGLKRRFMWTFHCNGYNGKELFQIFELQLSKQGYSINESDKSNIEKLFEEKIDCFPNFGGDTERLTNYSKTNHCFKLFQNQDKIKCNVLGYDDIKNGIEILNRNILKESNEVSKNPLINAQRSYKNSSVLDNLLNQFKSA
jgi:DNA polymerase III delta prime subunit